MAALNSLGESRMEAMQGSNYLTKMATTRIYLLPQLLMILKWNSNYRLFDLAHASGETVFSIKITSFATTKSCRKAGKSNKGLPRVSKIVPP